MSYFLFGFIYTYILFPDTAEKQSDASMWGINYLIRSISAISCRSAHIYHPNPLTKNSSIHSHHKQGNLNVRIRG